MTNNASALAMLDKPVVNQTPKKQLYGGNAPANKPDNGRDSNVSKEQQDATPKDFKETMASASQEKGSRSSVRSSDKTEKASVDDLNNADNGVDTAGVLAGAAWLPGEIAGALNVDPLKAATVGVVASGGEHAINPQVGTFNVDGSGEAALLAAANAEGGIPITGVQAAAGVAVASGGKGQGAPVLNVGVKTTQEAVLSTKALTEGEAEAALGTTAIKSTSAGVVIPANNGQLTQALSEKFMAQNSQGSAVKASAREVLIGEKSFAHQLKGAVQEEQETKPSFSVNDLSVKAATPAVDRVFVSANVRFGQPAWAGQIAERSANLASQNIKQAEIQLNPQDMGPINIKISIANEQATVTFAAQNAAVREALDSTMQRLKEAFDEEGLELVQADVTDQQSSSDGDSEAESGNGGASGEDENITGRHVVHVPQSAIDHFV